MKRRILAVDDEPSMLKLLERIIHDRTEYSIQTTSTAVEVPSILENSTFDVVILDLRMPGLSGMDILRMIRDKDRPEQVIVITAFASLESAIEAVTLGACGYLLKPFKREDLLTVLNRGMEQAQCKKEVTRIKLLTEESLTGAVEKFETYYFEILNKKYADNIAKICEVSRKCESEVIHRLNELMINRNNAH